MATHFDRVYCGKCSTTFLYEQIPGGKKPAPKPAAAAAPAAEAPKAAGKKGKK